MITYKELHEKYGEEKVFVVNKEEFSFIKEGLSTENKESILESLREKGFFVYRRNAEYNPKYLQLIPYVLITNKGKYFTSKRLKGDERLLDKISIGIGGHINPIDMKGGIENIFANNIKRELFQEELHIDKDKTESCMLNGFILYLDEKDLVSQDHLGLFYVLETSDSNVSIKETETLKGQFLTKEEILKNRNRTESWSKIIIDQYIK